ncbi:hypothetical protein SCLCIDRAFT_112074 [Scleroderma citrinum Foug A]|uniref:SET domain-containing protein n=1 Tax=Scleroderma citrinum Foug A TaxID=1036808 RepID=A0A0C3ALG2_9AGAM|nr:hypothetical protein SCLCIDRAFT_112074 [Scleroderma citrinum Foug A]
MAGCPATANDTDEHILNPQQCHVKHVRGKGRGVFASRAIPARTIIEVSPVLLFAKDEYNAHGRHTLLDHYAFNWRDGRMALPLGLGSLFNHSEYPNVSYSIDTTRDCIVYTSTRTIGPDEELCIFYGHNLWFNPVDVPNESGSTSVTAGSGQELDEWASLAGIQASLPDQGIPTALLAGNMDDDDAIDEDDLPFTWKRLSLDKEEEQINDIELVQAWVVDILDHKHIATMLRQVWLKRSGLETDALSHLKRIRRQGLTSTLLLCTSPHAPTLPGDTALGAPYQVSVPCNPALTQTSLHLKNTYWPTVFTPRRKWEPEKWTRGKLKWACNAIDVLKQECHKAATSDELPIVAFVPSPYANEDDLPQSVVAYDTRTSTCHPLRHAALNAIRKVADFRAAQPTPVRGDATQNQSGSQYLLTGLTLFTTHEPCIMCTMALLHSRMKEIFYMYAMPKTGGCGGVACVPALKGVNHRFTIAIWKNSYEEAGDTVVLPTLDPEIDA